jgi:hypothetical protein
MSYDRGHKCVYNAPDEVLDRSLEASIPLHALFSPYFSLYFSPLSCPLSSASDCSCLYTSEDVRHGCLGDQAACVLALVDRYFKSAAPHRE